MIRLPSTAADTGYCGVASLRLGHGQPCSEVPCSDRARLVDSDPLPDAAHW